MCIVQINLEYERNYRQFVYFAKYMNSPNPTDLVNDVYIHLSELEPNRLANYLSRYTAKDFIINTIKLFYYRERAALKRDLKLFTSDSLNDSFEDEVSELFDFEKLDKIIREMPEQDARVINAIKDKTPITNVLNMNKDKAVLFKKVIISEVKRKYFNND
jgi:hypothetical protein